MRHSYLLSIVHYDETTGIFRSLVDRRTVKVGDVLGAPNSRGYLRVTIDGLHYYLHRLAWFYVHGYWPRKLDHRNGVVSDNRLLNLRPCTNRQNGRNRKIAANNKSGVTGVFRVKLSGKFRACIKLREGRLVLGTFDDFEAACAARKKAEVKYFGEFRRGN